MRSGRGTQATRAQRAGLFHQLDKEIHALKGRSPFGATALTATTAEFDANGEAVANINRLDASHRLDFCQAVATLNLRWLQELGLRDINRYPELFRSANVRSTGGKDIDIGKATYDELYRDHARRLRQVRIALTRIPSPVPYCTEKLRGPMSRSEKWKKTAEQYRLGHPDVCRWVKFYGPEGGDIITLWSAAHESPGGQWTRFRIPYDHIEAMEIVGGSILELVLTRGGGAQIAGWHIQVLASLMAARLVRSLRPRTPSETPPEPIGPGDGFAAVRYDYGYPSCLDPTSILFDKHERFLPSHEQVPAGILLV